MAASFRRANAKCPSERSRIDVGNGYDLVFTQIVWQRELMPPVAGNLGDLTHNQAFSIGTPRFFVLQIDAVIANQRVGQGNDLA